MIRDFIQAARLRTLPLASACVLTGGALAAAAGTEQARFTPLFAGCLLTVVLLQILANFANDLGDFTNGADRAEGHQRSDRAVASGRAAADSAGIVDRLKTAACEPMEAMGIHALALRLKETQPIHNYEHGSKGPHESLFLHENGFFQRSYPQLGERKCSKIESLHVVLCPGSRHSMVRCGPPCDQKQRFLQRIGSPGSL